MTISEIWIINKLSSKKIPFVRPFLKNLTLFQKKHRTYRNFHSQRPSFGQIRGSNLSNATSLTKFCRATVISVCFQSQILPEAQPTSSTVTTHFRNASKKYRQAARLWVFIDPLVRVTIQPNALFLRPTAQMQSLKLARQRQPRTDNRGNRHQF